MKITIKQTRNLGEFHLELNDEEIQLADLKREVERASGIPCWAQRLFVNGRLLHKQEPISKIGVTSGCTLLLATAAAYVASKLNKSSNLIQNTENNSSSASAKSNSSAVAGNATDSTASSSTSPANTSSAASPSGPEAVAASGPTNVNDEISKMSIGELKRRLSALGVSIAGCTEKSELVKLLQEREAAVPGSALGSGSNTRPSMPAGAPSDSGAGRANMRDTTTRGASPGRPSGPNVQVVMNGMPMGSMGGMTGIPGLGGFGASHDGMGQPPFSAFVNIGSGMPMDGNPQQAMANMLQHLGPAIMAQVGSAMNQAMGGVHEQSPTPPPPPPGPPPPPPPPSPPVDSHVPNLVPKTSWPPPPAPTRPGQPTPPVRHFVIPPSPSQAPSGQPPMPPPPPRPGSAIFPGGFLPNPVYSVSSMPAQGLQGLFGTVPGQAPPQSTGSQSNRGTASFRDSGDRSRSRGGSRPSIVIGAPQIFTAQIPVISHTVVPRVRQPPQQPQQPSQPPQPPSQPPSQPPQQPQPQQPPQPPSQPPQ